MLAEVVVGSGLICEALSYLSCSQRTDIYKPFFRISPTYPFEREFLMGADPLRDQTHTCFFTAVFISFFYFTAVFVIFTVIYFS